MKRENLEFLTRKIVITFTVIFCLPNFAHTKTGPEADGIKFVLPSSEANKEYYPEAAVTNTKNVELDELKRLETIRETEALKKDQYEAEKVAAEIEIQKKKKEIQSLKLKQEKIYKDVEFSEIELKEAESNFQRVKSLYEEAQNNFEKVKVQNQGTKAEFEAKRSEFIKQSKLLLSAKSEFEGRMNVLHMQMEKMKRETANNEVELSQIANQRARLEAETARLQQEAGAVAEDLNLSVNKKEEALVELRATQLKYAQAKREYTEASKAKADTDREYNEIVERSAKLRKNLLAQIRETEMKTAESRSATAMLEIEKAKLEAENVKLRESLSQAVARNEEAEKKFSDERNVVLTMKMTLEKNNTEINRINSEVRKGDIDNDTLKVKMRKLASLAVSSGMTDEPIQSWRLKKNCFTYKNSESGAAKTGFLQKNLTVTGQSSGEFIRILNSSGRTLFIKSSCAEQLGSDQ